MRCPHCKNIILSELAQMTLDYMRRHAPKRGGFMFEGARPAYESGAYKDDELDQLLAIGAIEPHPDPNKGWIVSNEWRDTKPGANQ